MPGVNPVLWILSYWSCAILRLVDRTDFLDATLLALIQIADMMCK